MIVEVRFTDGTKLYNVEEKLKVDEVIRLNVSLSAYRGQSFTVGIAKIIEGKAIGYPVRVRTIDAEEVK